MRRGLSNVRHASTRSAISRNWTSRPDRGPRHCPCEFPVTGEVLAEITIPPIETRAFGNGRASAGLPCMGKEPKPTKPPPEQPYTPRPVEDPPQPRPDEDRPLSDPVPPDTDLPRM